jgi:hypothetical protein
VSSQTTFSFGTQKNNGIPVVFSGPNGAGSNVVIDPLFPGPVMIPQLEMFGVHTIIFPGDADYTLLQSTEEAFYRKYVVPNGVITATRTLIWPANPGKLYEILNNNAHTVNLTRAGSVSPFSLAAGASAKVYDDGTDIVVSP